jgi:hypothetical protein
MQLSLNTRYFHARMYGRFSRLMMPFFQSDAQFGAKLRDLFLPVGCRIPFVQRRMLRVLRGEVRGWSDLLAG